MIGSLNPGINAWATQKIDAVASPGDRARVTPSATQTTLIRLNSVNSENWSHRRFGLSASKSLESSLAILVSMRE
jgi:hypothetical protein